jgi:hypothetical protein
MRILVQFLKFILYCLIVAVEYVLKFALEVTLQAKKPFQ